MVVVAYPYRLAYPPSSGGLGAHDTGRAAGFRRTFQDYR